MEKNKALIVSPAPHFHKDINIQKVMWGVVISLLPALIGALYFFGWYSGVLVLLGIISAVGTEALSQKLFGRKITITDGSAVVTGILLSFNLPPTVPWWMPVVGSFFAILVVKQFFGGLGYNFLNPALAARAFLMASWPSQMTDFSHLKVHGGIISGIIAGKERLLDAVTSATPLGVVKAVKTVLSDPTAVDKLKAAKATIKYLNSFDTIKHLLFGNIGGVIGETSAVLLLLGAVYLLIRGIINLRIPVAYIGTVFILTGISYLLGLTPVTPFFHIFAGGLILGAFFMATDYVTSPVTPLGQWLFGVGCGVLTVLIRLWGGYPEGVSYSILLMNVATPLIDRYTKPKILGSKK